jgi:hypothetical protein
MGFESFNLSNKRRRNADGTRVVLCKNCGREIGNSSLVPSAVCYSCQTGNPQPVQIPIVGGMPRPDLVTGSNFDDLVRAIYSEDNEAIDVQAKRKKKWSPLDLISGAWRAMGFGRQVSVEINYEEVNYDTVVSETSKEIAKRKARQPIFKKETNR